MSASTEWNAGAYARISGLQQAMADEALALLALQGAERVLDVGCGQGKITARISERVPLGAVVGVDPSHDMIAYAASHFAAGRPNLRFEIADARTLPFDAEFDLVVSFNALHWIPEQDAALRSIRRAVKAGGRALLRLVTAGARKSLEAVVEETRCSARWRDRFSRFTDPYLRLTPAQYAALAKENGFRVVQMRSESKAWDFGSREAFHAFCAVGLVAWTSHVAEQDRRAFIDDVLDRYAASGAGDAKVADTFRFEQTDVQLAAVG